MTTSMENIPPYILHIHTALLHDGYYLADPNILQHLCWKRQGHKIHIFKNIPAQPPTTPLAFAPLCVITFISNNSFWLTSDAGWHKLTEISPSLLDAKATCVSTFPTGHTLLHDNFQLALNHINDLVQMVTLALTRQGFTQIELSCLKFCHVLFEACKFSLSIYTI